MKPMRNAFLSLVAVLALGACTYDKFDEIEALNEVQAVGSPFTQNLAQEYRAFVNREHQEMLDYPDALHFARKGLAAAAGKTVLPEPLVDWNLLPQHIEELGAARGRLMVAFDVGAREIDPVNSAIAQVRFDCWIEQQEENWQADDIGGCKSGFMNALAALEAGLGQLPPPPPAVQVPPPIEPIAEPVEPMAPEDAMYLVFFEWDEAEISSSATSVLDAVAEAIRERQGTFDIVNIVGHADTSGPEAYNRKLAMRRANAVRDALIQRGIDPAMLRVESRGEQDLLVQTDDNVREPANRRANISFE
ncbi:MAG: OmpA family protein [Alphaproteobacteria bacterium]|nr:OmpA family protein [Alphaproteobacteria bacterium]